MIGLTEKQTENIRQYCKYHGDKNVRIIKILPKAKPEECDSVLVRLTNEYGKAYSAILQQDMQGDFIEDLSTARNGEKEMVERYIVENEEGLEVDA